MSILDLKEFHAFGVFLIIEVLSRLKISEWLNKDFRKRHHGNVSGFGFIVPDLKEFHAFGLFFIDQRGGNISASPRQTSSRQAV